MIPYGVATKIQGDLRSDFEYAGMYYHEASGLNLTLYRAYNPTLGRWLSRDPSMEQSGLNFYCYVGNNSINFYDPSGLIRWTGVLNSTAGIIGNAFGVAGGVALAVGTSPTGIGGVVGGLIAVKSGYGLAANIAHLYDAFEEKPDASKGSLINDLASKLMPCNKDAQMLATALDLTLDLAGGRFASAAKTLSKADSLGSVILEGGAELGPTFSQSADRSIAILTGTQVVQTALTTTMPTYFGDND